VPRRFLRLSWYRRNEYRILAALILYAIVFLFYAQHQQANDIRDQSRRADARFAAISRENQARSLAASASAYASCRRQQEQVAIQREFYHLILPKRLAGRTAAQQAAVASFYHDLAAHHVLTIPVCQRPPTT
jgi:hypothetical protein